RRRDPAIFGVADGILDRDLDDDIGGHGDSGGERDRSGAGSQGRLVLDGPATALDSTQPTGTTSSSATTKTRSPGSGVIIPRPVKLPNAGNTVTFSPT